MFDFKHYCKLRRVDKKKASDYLAILDGEKLERVILSAFNKNDINLVNDIFNYASQHSKYFFNKSNNIEIFLRIKSALSSKEDSAVILCFIRYLNIYSDEYIKSLTIGLIGLKISDRTLKFTKNIRFLLHDLFQIKSETDQKAVLLQYQKFICANPKGSYDEFRMHLKKIGLQLTPAQSHVMSQSMQDMKSVDGVLIAPPGPSQSDLACKATFFTKDKLVGPIIHQTMPKVILSKDENQQRFIEALFVERPNELASKVRCRKTFS